MKPSACLGGVCVARSLCLGLLEELPHACHPPLHALAVLLVHREIHMVLLEVLWGLGGH
jgi:hypothetical protein